MKELEPEINRLKQMMKDDRQGQALKMMALYKEKKISPFSSFLVLLVQLPIIWALYSIFFLASMKSTGTGVNTDTSSNIQMDIAQNMTKSMKYVFPIMVFFISYNIAAVVALYWTVTSIFTLGQEIVVRRHLKKHQPL